MGSFFCICMRIISEDKKRNVSDFSEVRSFFKLKKYGF